MTIAMCYMSPEGIVLGADSTSSAVVSAAGGNVGYHYLNYNQKLFELGENATVGVLTWGLGSLTAQSHRTLLALLADDLARAPAPDVHGIMARWITQFWAAYSTDPAVQLFRQLGAKTPFDPNVVPPNPAARTKDEEQAFTQLTDWLVVGFCIAGYILPNRTPTALQVSFAPTLAAPPAPVQIPLHVYAFWGAPNMIKRLINGSDDNLKNSILRSGKWAGTDAELTMLLSQHQLGHPLLPIRDAIDFVHACIHSTIKALKFSNLAQVCGGPIELAVITTDRRFRWVRHKQWDAAIVEGEI